MTKEHNCIYHYFSILYTKQITPPSVSQPAILSLSLGLVMFKARKTEENRKEKKKKEKKREKKKRENDLLRLHQAWDKPCTRRTYTHIHIVEAPNERTETGLLGWIILHML